MTLNRHSVVLSPQNLARLAYNLGAIKSMIKRKRNTTIDLDHPAIEKYYATLVEYKNQKVLHEGAVSTAFENLLTALSTERSATRMGFPG